MVKLRSETTDYNGIVTKLEEVLIDDVTTTAATTDFATKTLNARTVKTVNLETSLVSTLQLSAAASVEKILWVLPPFWDISAATGIIQTEDMTVELFENSYNPAVLMTMPSGSNLSDSSSYSVTLDKVKNPPYFNIGNGSVIVAALVAGEWFNISSLDSNTAATEAGVLGMSIESNNLHNKGGDATYVITLTTATSIPAGGEINIDFPTGYSLINSGCTMGSTIVDQDPGTTDRQCVINLLNIKITQFAAIAAATDIIVWIDTVKNPDNNSQPTASFQANTLYDTVGGKTIDEVTTGKTVTLTADLTPGSAEITGIEFYPINTGAKSDMVLSFTVQSSVPNSGLLTIVVPGGYTLPSSLNN